MVVFHLAMVAGPDDDMWDGCCYVAVERECVIYLIVAKAKLTSTCDGYLHNCNCVF